MLAKDVIKEENIEKLVCECFQRDKNTLTFENNIRHPIFLSGL